MDQEQRTFLIELHYRDLDNLLNSSRALTDTLNRMMTQFSALFLTGWVFLLVYNRVPLVHAVVGTGLNLVGLILMAISLTVQNHLVIAHAKQLPELNPAFP